MLFAEGATSQVFRALHEASGTPVAVKVLKTVDGEQLRRFRFEADVLRRLDHPGIARLVDAGEWDGRPFIATEFIDGAPFDRALSGRSLETVVRAFVKAVDALAHAHDRGLLHRDLKPANVLVRDIDGEPEPIVVDFGLAADVDAPAETASGALLGTPAFMAPEQAHGDRQSVDRRTDLYGLGTVLYATLAGRAPYEAPSSGDLIAAILAGPPPRPGAGVPRRLEAIIDCAMARRPENRYDSARRLAADLDAWLDGQGVRAMRGFRWRLAGRTIRRHRWATAAASALAVVLVLLGLQQIWLESRSAERQERALQLNERLARNREQMRLAHLAPRHDITPARERLEREIEALERMARQPANRDAPVLRLVLGQMLLDAGETADAVVVLESARRQGCRSERCAAALALGHLRLYEQNLERQLAFSGSATDRGASPELVRARELVAESGLSGLADLRLAALSRPLEEVVRRVELRVADEPWQYDALLALAESRYRAGLEAVRADRLDEAMRLLGAAENDFDRARAIARSLPAAYLGACRARARRMEIVTTGRVVAEIPLADLSDSCRLAATVLPGHVAAYSMPALVLERLAVQARRAGSHDLAAGFIEQALEVMDRAPHDLLDQPALQTARARVLMTAVRARQLEPDDAAAHLREALALSRSATEADPNSTASWHARAIALGLLSARPVNDAPALAREAVEIAERVAQRWPQHRGVRNLLGSTLLDLAYRQRLEGGSGRDTLQRALTVLQRLVDDAPDYDSARNNLGMAYWELAMHEMGAGGDFRTPERRARSEFRRILDRTPDHPSAKINLSSLNLTLAEMLIEHDRPPGDRTDRSIALLGELRETGEYFACDMAYAYWLKVRAATESDPADRWRGLAMDHAAAGEGADCAHVLAAVQGG
ncbi:MAG: protein kinase domain-containing protein [Candidatus Wenzhouxiangella sp. M2_3B_020]